MILANERVAAAARAAPIPTLYRVHERPDPQRIELMVEQLASLDLPTPPLPERLGPREAARASPPRRAAWSPPRRTARARARGVYILVLRALKQAHYAIETSVTPASAARPMPLHLADPPLSGPDRPPGAALGPRRGGKRRARRVVAETAVGMLRARAGLVRIERDADDVCAAFLLQRELFERGRARASRARSPG